MDIYVDDDDQLLNAKQIAKKLGINVRTFYNWRSKNRPTPPCVMLNGRIRSFLPQVIEWLKEGSKS